jgi:hypothetical protein
MAKQAGDGKLNYTKEQQKANKTDEELAKEAIVKEHGMDGLGKIAERGKG